LQNYYDLDKFGVNKMVNIKKFEDIDVWQKARELTNKIYETSCTESFANDFTLKGQTRKASLSIMLNIAEGYARRSNREFRKFLDYAHGSCAEVQSALYIAFDQKYISEQQFNNLYGLTEEISKMITGFSLYLRTTISK
jgi:four helix bundle protein